MIKMFHCADLHLDSPMSALDITKSEVRRNELRAAFTSLTLSAKMNGADFLIISGDLFDCEYVSRDTISLIVKEFAAIPDCKIIIAPGNHDPYTSSGYYRRTDFPDNVYVFDSPEIKSFDFPEKNTTVYGYAFTEEHMETNPLEGFTVADPLRINILAAHCDLDAADSKYCPITSASIAESGFDYAALGHRHTYTEPGSVGNGFVSYSGCLEGRGFDECGIKGALLAAIEKGDSLKFASKFVRFCKRIYAQDTLNISGARSNADAASMISAHISENHYGDDTALRLRLTGEVSGDFRLSPAFLKEQFPSFFIFEIVDETVPLLDGDRLRDDPTLKGAFYRSLEPMLKGDDEAKRECAALALRCGLAALAGNDFTDI